MSSDRPDISTRVLDKVRPAHPPISSGTSPATFTNVPPGMSKDHFHVTFYWQGKKRELDMGPDFFATGTFGSKIEGWRREASAAYLLLRDGNRCTISDPIFCTMKGLAFTRPAGADFDHIVLPKNGGTDQLSNLRLACHSCNSHQQKLQWKSEAAPTSTQLRERESAPGRFPATKELPPEIDINLRAYPVFCRYLKDRLDEEEEVTVDDIISSGAKHCRKKTGNGSVQSARNWLKLETSREGDYEIVEGMVRKREKKLTTVKTPELKAADKGGRES